jgi:hypothetical protein
MTDEMAHQVIGPDCSDLTSPVAFVTPPRLFCSTTLTQVAQSSPILTQPSTSTQVAQSSPILTQPSLLGYDESITHNNDAFHEDASSNADHDISELVEDMYNKSFDLVADGGQGIILPAPKGLMRRQSRCMTRICMPRTLIPQLMSDTRDGLQKSKQYWYVCFFVMILFNTIAWLRNVEL